MKLYSRLINSIFTSSFIQHTIHRTVFIHCPIQEITFAAIIVICTIEIGKGSDIVIGNESVNATIQYDMSSVIESVRRTNVSVNSRGNLKETTKGKRKFFGVSFCDRIFLYTIQLQNGKLCSTVIRTSLGNG